MGKRGFQPKPKPTILPAVIKEAKKVAGFSFLYNDLPMTDEDHGALARLALLMADVEQLSKYPTWTARAGYCGVSYDRLHALRRTPEYRVALKEAVRLKALEGSASLVDNLASLGASATDARETAAAFKVLSDVGGAAEPTKGATFIKNQQITNNVSLEQRLLAGVKERLGIAPSQDASFEVIDGPPKR